jgi:hypothetical protein
MSADPLADQVVNEVFAVLGIPATYQPAAGQPATLNVVPARGPLTLPAFGGGAQYHDGRILGGRVADVAAAAAGDIVTVGGASYRVRSAVTIAARSASMSACVIAIVVQWIV